jgi:hypothetical protein
MAANLFERRSLFLVKLMPLNRVKLLARENELKAKGERAVDEDEELVVIQKSLALMGEDKEDPERSLGAWIAKMLINAE